MAMQQRPPVITIMGHVDHGKTTLLDYIRRTNVAAREAGGITQHIGAYQIEFNGQKMTFIDTPGHAAFSKMRERGAKATDIVVLVVAVNDGVKPQTIESIRHIKEAGAPVVVALNKSDIKDTYPDMVKAQLAEQGVLVQGFGGSIDAIPISAKSGMGVDQLLETIQVMAELQDLKADPEAPLDAVVIESTKDPRRGPVATVIVHQGTLKVRQDIYADQIQGRVRQLTNELGQQLNDVLPGSPAEIVGLTDVPPVGSIVRDQSAEYSQEEVAESENNDAMSAFGVTDFSALLEDKPKLHLIIKADVEGTLEAIRMTLDEESVELVEAGVGPVVERDLEMAKATGSTIISFHTKVSKQIKELAKRQGVKIKSYDVIYHLIEDLQKQMLRLLEPTIDEVITGEAEILQIFEMKGDRIAGSRVITGEIKRSDLLHLRRGDENIANPVIKSMMHNKEEIQSVKAKNEFGMTFRNKKLDFKVGDRIIAYRVEDEE
jgi:translation initiation factor IF-2